jgi:hypothetical protein
VSIPTGSIVVRLTLLGDTDLDRQVGFPDLLTLAQNYTQVDKYWFEGDFTGEGEVGFADLLALAQNYNAPFVQTSELAGLSPEFMIDVQHAFSVIPEPTLLSGLVVAGVALMRRR